MEEQPVHRKEIIFFILTEKYFFLQLVYLQTLNFEHRIISECLS